MSESHRNFFIFLGRSALFAVGFLFIFVAANVFYHFRVVKNDIIFTLLDRFTKQDVQPHVLLLGDSHAALDIRSKFLDEGYYNFSSPGEGWREMILRMHAAVKLKKPITHVVIPLDDHAFAPYRANDLFFTNFLHFSDSEDIKEVFKPSFATFFKTRVSSALPLVSPSNRSLLRKVIGEDVYAFMTKTTNEKAVILDAWGGMVPTDELVWSEFRESRRKEEIASRAAKHFREPLVNKELMSLFEGFLAYCKQHNIMVIGVHYPVTTDYQNAGVSTNARELEELHEQYRNLPLAAHFDYYHAFDHQQNYFRDPDHLNTAGAIVFSQMLMNDLREIIK